VSTNKATPVPGNSINHVRESHRDLGCANFLYFLSNRADIAPERPIDEIPISVEMQFLSINTDAILQDRRIAPSLLETGMSP